MNKLVKTILALGAMGLATHTPSKALSEEYKPQGENCLEEVACYDNSLEIPQKPEANIPELTRRIGNYWLSEGEYNHIHEMTDSNLIKRFEQPKYAGFLALMRHKDTLDFVADHYQLNPKQILQIMNQESSFNIGIRGASGERGIGQKMPETAQRLVNRITNPEHELNYPFLEKEDYKFWKLSTDYDLNIVLTGAMIKIAEKDLNRALKNQDLTKKEFKEIVKDKGSRERFRILANGLSERFKYYKVDRKLIHKINQHWRYFNPEDHQLNYLTYNGGVGAVKNLMSNKSVSEVLQINFYNFNRKKEEVEHYLSIYDNFLATQEVCFE